jgi:hypothetical protein
VLRLERESEVRGVTGWSGGFGGVHERTWGRYVLADSYTYRTDPRALLFATDCDALSHHDASRVLLRIFREDAELCSELCEAYRIPNYRYERDTLDALIDLLGISFDPFNVNEERLARLLVLQRRPLRRVAASMAAPEARTPLLSEERSWIRVACVDDGHPAQPVSGVRLEIVTASGDVYALRTGEDGLVTLDGIAPGRASIRVLDRDASTWRPHEGAEAAPCGPDESFSWVEVRRGDCLSRVARRHGFADWQDIWRFRANAALRAQRKSPHVLHPGDMLAVPALRRHELVRATEQTHRIVIDRSRVRRGYVLEARPLRFHPKSAVLLAQYVPASDDEVRSDAPGLDALGSALLHAEAAPDRPMLLVGHSDATETPEGDRTLSEARASGVRHLLRGEREAWVGLAQAHSCPEDLTAILRWCAETRGWSCTPSEHDDAAALKAFQRAYNESHDGSIAVDGSLDSATWGAIFDLYQHQLAQCLETDVRGLETRQSALQFCAVAKDYGCGGAVAVHAQATADDGVYRRSDVLFFEPGDEPLARDLVQGPLVQPDFDFTPLALRTVPSELVRLAVRELVYPGTEADSMPLEGKWLYAVSNGALAFSLRAASATAWHVTRTSAPGPEFIRDGHVRLQAARSYRLFLSPVQLSDAALDRLLANVDQCVWLTSVDRPGELHREGAPVLVRDVFQWALDLHRHEYRPKLDIWQEWLQDEQRASRHLIASALQGILDHGDELGIRAHLRSGEPAQFLEQHAIGESEARRGAEQAAFLLASFIDCEDHRVIEQAHVDGGTEGAELAVLHWASVLGDLAQSFEGRQLLDVVAADEERVPRRFVFADPPPLVLAFGDKRYLGLAGRSLLKDLGPSLLAHLYPKQTPKAREAVARFLERLGESKPLIGTYRQIATNIHRGRKLTRNVKSRKSVQKLVHVAEKAAEAAYQAQLPKGLVASKRLADAYTRNLEALDAGAMFVVEAVNLALALQGVFDDGSDKPTFETMASAIGASADLGVALIEAHDLLLQATKRGAKSVLGVISGICDCVGFVQAARRASSQYDYDQAFGHGIAAAGAGAMFVGSALTYANAYGGGSAAAASGAAAAGWEVALGSLLGAAGILAIAVGVTVAKLTEDNEYQQFAKLCFLGSKYGATEGKQLSWSPVKLPARRVDGSPDPVGEAAALITLLSSFELEFTGSSLALHPRLYRPGDVMEIYVEVHPINYAPNACVLEVDLETESVVQLRGLRPVCNASKVMRHASGRVTRIEIDLHEAAPPSSPAVVQYYGGLARARLRFAHGGTTRFVPPIPIDEKSKAPQEPWVQVSATYGDVSAALASRRRGVSSDASLHVDGLKEPVQPGMKELHD